jgi:hypothetical protein
MTTTMAGITDLPPLPAPPPNPAACAGCGGLTFTTTWQTFANGTRHVRMNCAACGRFQRYLPQDRDGRPAYRHETRPADAHAAELRPPPASWCWIGYVRPGDGVWYAVAQTASLAGCWDALLTTHVVGDRLCVPTEPTRGTGKARAEGPILFEGTGGEERP